MVLWMMGGYPYSPDCMVSRRSADPQFDLFVPYVTDLPLRDQRETMERPFFSLSKRKRLKPIEYESRDGILRPRENPKTSHSERPLLPGSTRQPLFGFSRGRSITAQVPPQN